MRRVAKLFFWVLAISFTGSLPPGTLNTGVTDLVVNRGVLAAIQFGSGAVLVEVVLVRAVLAALRRWEGMRRVTGPGRPGGMSGMLRWGGIVGCAVLFLLAIISVRGAVYREGGAVSMWGDMPLVSGMLLSLLNPLHLPFWMGWMAVLRSRRVLGDGVPDHHVFAGAVGLGTVLAFVVYGMTGRLFTGWLQLNKGLLNWLIALTLLAAGVMQLRRVILSNIREQ